MTPIEEQNNIFITDNINQQRETLDNLPENNNNPLIQDQAFNKKYNFTKKQPPKINTNYLSIINSFNQGNSNIFHNKDLESPRTIKSMKLLGLNKSDYLTTHFQKEEEIMKLHSLIIQHTSNKLIVILQQSINLCKGLIRLIVKERQNIIAHEQPKSQSLSVSNRKKDKQYHLAQFGRISQTPYSGPGHVRSDSEPNKLLFIKTAFSDKLEQTAKQNNKLRQKVQSEAVLTLKEELGAELRRKILEKKISQCNQNREQLLQKKKNDFKAKNMKVYKIKEKIKQQEIQKEEELIQKANEVITSLIKNESKDQESVKSKLQTDSDKLSKYEQNKMKVQKTKQYFLQKQFHKFDQEVHKYKFREKILRQKQKEDELRQTQSSLQFNQSYQDHIHRAKEIQKNQFELKLSSLIERQFHSHMKFQKQHSQTTQNSSLKQSIDLSDQNKQNSFTDKLARIHFNQEKLQQLKQDKYYDMETSHQKKELFLQTHLDFKEKMLQQKQESTQQKLNIHSKNYQKIRFEWRKKCDEQVEKDKLHQERVMLNQESNVFLVKRNMENSIKNQIDKEQLAQSLDQIQRYKTKTDYALKYYNIYIHTKLTYQRKLENQTNFQSDQIKKIQNDYLIKEKQELSKFEKTSTNPKKLENHQNQFF